MLNFPRIGTWLIAASAGLALAAGAASPPSSPKPSGKSSGRTSYKWVDEQGVTHYGDGIPPEAAQADAQVLNRNAVAVRDVASAKTGPQEDARVHNEEVAAKQRQRDRFLLTSYTSVHDIEQLRDERIAQVGAQVIATQGYVDTLAQRLQTLKMRAANFKPYSASPEARRLPDNLAAELAAAISEDQSQRKSLAMRQQEIKATREAFQADIDRYKQLTGK